jgi:hypothetical protein
MGLSSDWPPLIPKMSSCNWIGCHRTLIWLAMGTILPKRIAFIVATLRKLRDENKLPAETASWLPLAEEMLANLPAQSR